MSRNLGARVIQACFVLSRPQFTTPGPEHSTRQPSRLGHAIQVAPWTPTTAPSQGKALPNAVQARLESIFKASFADVRVHLGLRPHQVGAQAVTMGSSIYFAPGHYNTATALGQRLLGHEIAHVVQQLAHRVRNPFGSGLALVMDPGLEAEAHRMAMLAVRALTPLQTFFPQHVVQQKTHAPEAGGALAMPSAPRFSSMFLAPHVQAAVVQAKGVRPQAVTRANPRLSSASRVAQRMLSTKKDDLDINSFTVKWQKGSKASIKRPYFEIDITLQFNDPGFSADVVKYKQSATDSFIVYDKSNLVLGSSIGESWKFDQYTEDAHDNDTKETWMGKYEFSDTPGWSNGHKNPDTVGGTYYIFGVRWQVWHAKSGKVAMPEKAFYGVIVHNFLGDEYYSSGTITFDGNKYNTSGSLFTSYADAVKLIKTNYYGVDVSQ